MVFTLLINYVYFTTICISSGLLVIILILFIEFSVNTMHFPARALTNFSKTELSTVISFLRLFQQILAKNLL